MVLRLAWYTVVHLGMVATDGYKFGDDQLIWEWHSTDLLTWSKQRAINVMAKYKGQYRDTWCVRHPPVPCAVRGSLIANWSTRM